MVDDGRWFEEVEHAVGLGENGAGGKWLDEEDTDAVYWVGMCKFRHSFIYFFEISWFVFRSCHDFNKTKNTENKRRIMWNGVGNYTLWSCL